MKRVSEANPEDEEVEELKIRPYARLLAMLGDQLIKNERIALIELVKNSYDADAGIVEIKFENFGEYLESTPSSKISILDDGEGMSIGTVKNAWMNPATPHKARKNSLDRRSPVKRRIIQGEKGIGRFAILKLGSVINIITREKGAKQEYEVIFDFSAYDNEFTEKNGIQSDIFLDSVPVTLRKRNPQTFVDNYIKTTNGTRERIQGHGTLIEIRHIKGIWTPEKVNSVCDDLLKLQSIFTKLFPAKYTDPVVDFNVKVQVNGEETNYKRLALEDLGNLMSSSSVLRIEEGRFHKKNGEFVYTFKLNDQPKTVRFDDLRSDRWIREKFEDAGSENKIYPKFGPFGFSFYVFDLKAPKDSVFYLSQEDVKRIKEHRVYLYRDGVRVYPYGEKEDDWLGIDIARGTVSASAFLSNDQVIGSIEISHSENPLLKDKTSREGLIDDSDAADQFTSVIRGFLSYVRSNLFHKHRARIARLRREKALKEGRADQALLPLYSHLKGKKDEKGYTLAASVERAFQTERDALTQRAETTEDLAAVGIAVETASHDLMLMMDRVVAELDTMISSELVAGREGTDLEKLQKIRGMVAFIDQRMRDLQALFKSSKQRRRPIRIIDSVEKVLKIYNSTFAPSGIAVDVVKIGSPLVAKCTDAVLLQLLINLFDNSLYWLKQVPKNGRLIRITLDGSDNKMIFSDSGPGIEKDDEAYIFDPWFSGKGEDGRGLGLYIARQLLERLDFSIDLAELRKDKILRGANFVIDFTTKNNE